MQLGSGPGNDPANHNGKFKRQRVEV